MSLQIDGANRIIIDGKQTGLALVQRQSGTVIYSPESSAQKYVEHQMPHPRYSAAHDRPASGVAGRLQLESDIRALLLTASKP